MNKFSALSPPHQATVNKTNANTEDMPGNTLHILLLRHGQTDSNASGVLQGHQPTPLNRLGIQQAHALANRLHSYRPSIDVLISSDLPRATQTAGPIAAACGLPVVTDNAWRERSFGLLEGKPVGVADTWRAASGEIDPPGSEPITEMHKRIRDALFGICDEHSDKQMVAVVTHGGPIRAILKMFNDGRIEPTRGHDKVEVPLIINCSILQLTARMYRTGIKWKLDFINDAKHLSDVTND